MLVGSKTVGVPKADLRGYPTLSPSHPTWHSTAVLVDAQAALRHLDYNGRLYHRSRTAWEDPIDLTRSRSGVALGSGFYVATDKAKPEHSTGYGPHLKLVTLPIEALEGKTAFVTNNIHTADKEGASLTVLARSYFIAIHDTDLIEAATISPFFTPREVFPTSAPAGG